MLFLTPEVHFVHRKIFCETTGSGSPPDYFCFYCRCVKSNRLSNNKKKGTWNKKNGNKYLGWVYIEAARLSFLKYPADYLQTYLDNIDRVTGGDVLRIAK